jgi:hypothetical protein
MWGNVNIPEFVDVLTKVGFPSKSTNNNVDIKISVHDIFLE